MRSRARTRPYHGLGPILAQLTCYGPTRHLYICPLVHEQWGDSVATLDQVEAQIRFSLANLSASSAHHTFEKICRYLAHAKICRNILARARYSLLCSN